MVARCVATHAATFAVYRARAVSAAVAVTWPRKVTTRRLEPVSAKLMRLSLEKPLLMSSELSTWPVAEKRIRCERSRSTAMSPTFSIVARAIRPRV